MPRRHEGSAAGERKDDTGQDSMCREIGGQITGQLRPRPGRNARRSGMPALRIIRHGLDVDIAETVNMDQHDTPGFALPAGQQP